MASDRMTALVTDLDTASFNAGFETGKGYGPVCVRFPSKVIETRIILLREIDLLETRAELWFNARLAALVEDDLVASHHSLTGR